MQLLTICINVNILQATHVAYLMGKRNARCVTSNYDSINIRPGHADRVLRRRVDIRRNGEVV